jgi:hypothetical protein
LTCIGDIDRPFKLNNLLIMNKIKNNAEGSHLVGGYYGPMPPQFHVATESKGLCSSTTSLW